MSLVWLQWFRELVDFIRPRLDKDLNLYVRSDGKDSNHGLKNDARGAFGTLQKAIDVYQALDTRGFDVTVNVADGDYTAGMLIDTELGGGTLTITGNTTTPASCTLTVANDNCFEVAGHPAWAPVTIQGFKLVTTTAGSGIVASGGSVVRYASMDFGSCIDYHLSAIEGALIQCTGAYNITAGAKAHFYCDHAEIGHPSAAATVTITNTPAFSEAFARALYMGLIDIRQLFTFSGSATGTRYEIDQNSVINTAGAGATYLPGNAGGTTANGGIYI